METNVKKLSLALFSAVVLMSACKKENIVPLMNVKDISNKAEQMKEPEKTMVPTDKVEPEDQIVKTKWKIDGFNHNGQVLKQDYYRDYIFEFNKHDFILASKKESAVNGKWNVVMEKGEKVIVIDFGKIPFIELNSHWKIKEISSQYLTMYNETDGMLSFVAADEALESEKEK
jgi:hypothetical protein